MDFAFEVKETDLWGRVGTIRANGKVLETPCLLPVIHPVNQLVSTGELRSMGFRGLMTNSYIIHSRRREEAVKKGIHELFGFDGVFMTDSGGYQALEYGDLGMSYGDVAELQLAIGSEMAVTLDSPTGYPQARKRALETMEYSLRNAKATMKEFGDNRTTWMGPVQGGLHLDLVRRSAKGLVGAGFEILALGSPVQVMENYMFTDLVRMIVAAKKSIPYSVPLHLFGAGHPLTTPLAVALGCDTFDSASYILFARNNRYMTRGGVLRLESMKFLPCSCIACAKTSMKELMEIDARERTKLVAVHNLYILREEVEAAKEAIVEGRLWDLVEERSMAHPKLREAFYEFATYGHDMEFGTPTFKDKGLFLRSDEDLKRPEIIGARRRLKRALRVSESKARIVVPGPKGPPHRLHRSDGTEAGRDMYRIHPALGVYPAELDFVYPFTQTVSAGAGSGRSGLGQARSVLRKLGYASASVSTEPGKGARSRRSPRDASPSPRLA
ncbi:MAG: tRNA guanosine(15) transglycosylase TgtA [Thaumarchaeota archaeon]|nr:tRNA guanosine(15) transglycosylase TgtA [Nitrososphaerota archaeon]